MKKGPLDIPTNWPNPWVELGEGHWKILRLHILHWKLYRRRNRFGIYGFARGHYNRIWYGRKVIHFKIRIKRTKVEE